MIETRRLYTLYTISPTCQAAAYPFAIIIPGTFWKNAIGILTSRRYERFAKEAGNLLG